MLFFLFLSGVVTRNAVSLVPALSSSAFVSLVFFSLSLLCFHLRSEEQSHSFQPNLPLFFDFSPKNTRMKVKLVVLSQPCFPILASRLFILLSCTIFSSCMSPHTFLRFCFRPLFPYLVGTVFLFLPLLSITPPRLSQLLP